MQFDIQILADSVMMLESTSPLFFYFAVFVLALWDALIVLGMIIPGTVLVVLAGYFIASGDISFTPVFVFLFLGAALGDFINFSLGKYVGRERLLKYLPFASETQIHRADHFFNTYGAPSILFVRYITFIKDLVPAFAGAVGMKTRTFLFWNLLGAVAWSASYLALGYGISEIAGNMDTIRSQIFVLSVSVIIVLVLVISINKLIFHHLHRYD